MHEFNRGGAQSRPVDHDIRHFFPRNDRLIPRQLNQIDRLVVRILAEPKLWLKGGSDALAAMGG